MSLPTRAGLAMAVALAGGWGLPGPLGLAVAVLVILGLVASLGLWSPPEPDSEPEPRPTLAAELLGHALLLALLARTLGRIIVAVPAAVWAVPVVLATVVGVVALGRWARRRESAIRTPVSVTIGIALGLGALTLSGAAALGGARFEAAGPQARGRVDSSPVLGVHPRQAIAVTLDGFGPHDIIVDDYVDPPGGQGYDPERWAARLEAELHTIAELHYATGPTRARTAFADAQVEVREALVPPNDRPLYPSLVGIEVRSGTTGAGSTVAFVCPGQARDPRPPSPELGRSCPRKYLIDGSAGLGLSPRFPGYTQVLGQDRARLARLLGWPVGDAQADRRSLALESAAWLLGLVLISLVAVGLGLVIGRGRAAARRPTQPGGWDAVALAGVTAVVGVVLVPLLTAKAIALDGSPTLAGEDPIVALAQARERLGLLGLGWSEAGAIAGSIGVVALGVGAAICAAALVDRSRAWIGAGDRERRHTPADARALARALGLALALALGLALALALRKPIDDPALLGSAAALLLLAMGPLRPWGRQLALTLTASLGAAAPVLAGAVAGPIAAALVMLGASTCLVLGLLGLRERPNPSRDGHGRSP